MCTWRDKTDTHAQNKHSWLNRRLCHLILYNPSQNVAEEQAKLLKERGEKKKKEPYQTKLSISQWVSLYRALPKLQKTGFLVGTGQI